ncbi:ABC transporter substrate-binding protein [Pseudactinotalea sp. Z1739]|uniref:ABC transporter substrate-binding protein n=1 Tax=Pseudactinotalea sp. Z1739 TaxID=3413028 RepID=UPI003C7DBDAC
MAMILAACGRGGATRSSGDAGSGENGGGEAITMRTALWGNADRAQLYEEACAMYADTLEQDVTFDMSFAELGPYLERLATTAAANDLPDVFFMRDTHVGWYGQSGSLLDLTPYLGDIIQTDEIGEAAVGDGTVDGGVYALPTHYVGQALFYDVAMAEEAGIDPGALTTWDDLADAAREAHGIREGIVGLHDPTMDNSTQRFLEAYIRQAGEEVYTPEGGIGFSEDTIASWLEFWHQLRSDGVITPPDLVLELDGSGVAGGMIATNRCVLALMSTNHYVQVVPASENEIGLTSLPILPDGTDDWWFFPPILISAGANTQHPEIAAGLINFLVNDTEAGEHTLLNQGAPSSAAVRDTILPLLDDAQRAFVEQISREQEYPRRAFPVRPEGSEEVNTSIGRNSTAVAYGEMSVSDAAAAIVSESTAALGGA